MKYKSLIGVAFLMLVCAQAYGQRFSVSTNAVSYLNLGTLNVEASYAPARHWTVTAGARYNPFTFNGKNGEFRNRQQSYNVGMRYWPWHTFSGWWVAAKVQYQEYNAGGILSAETEEGDRWGGGFSAGYTYMVTPNVNIEFGLGLWAGMKKYVVYSCPTCGITVDSGTKAFILPNEIIIGISYVF